MNAFKNPLITTSATAQSGDFSKTCGWQSIQLKIMELTPGKQSYIDAGKALVCSLSWTGDRKWKAVDSFGDEVR